MPRVIVLGTGTNVGKSYVTRALARALASVRPKDAVGALKPIETGFNAASSDAAALAGVTYEARPPDIHPLYRYAEPLTPYLAARRAGVSVDLGAVVRWLREWESAARGDLASAAPNSNRDQSAVRPVWSIVESAGGAFSPIAETGGRALTNVDLWQALKPCTAVLVARDGLGTLHDIAATLEALSARGLSAEHLVLSAAGPADASCGTNADVLRALGIAHPTAVLGEGEADLARLARALVDRALPSEARPSAPD